MKRRQQFSVIEGGASDRTGESGFLRACRELERIRPQFAGTVHEMVIIMLQPRRPSRQRAGHGDSSFILDCLKLERIEPKAAELLELSVAGRVRLARLGLDTPGKVHEP